MHLHLVIGCDQNLKNPEVLYCGPDKQAAILARDSADPAKHRWIGAARGFPLSWTGVKPPEEDSAPVAAVPPEEPPLPVENLHLFKKKPKP